MTAYPQVMQLAAKQLLKLGVKPEVIVSLEEQASAAGISLREHVQKVLAVKTEAGRCYAQSADGTGRCILEPRHPGEHVFRGLPSDYWETAQ